MYDLGFIGVGVMGGAILDQVIANLKNLPDEINPHDILIYDIQQDRLSDYSQKGISVSKHLNTIFEECKIVIIGVKPQQYIDLIKNINSFSCNTIVTMMAGIKINSILEKFNDVEVIRIMPNLPIKIGKGVIAYSHNNKNFNLDKVVDLLKHCGKTIEVLEKDFDIITSISGSGPAYVAYFAKAMINSAISMGLDHDIAKNIALTTIEGTSQYLYESKDNLSEFIDKVCSKGGTTIEAINEFDRNDLSNTILKGILKCKDRATELSEEV